MLPFAQCGECELCLAGNEQVCPHAIPNGVGLGTGRPGGYAEQMVADARMLFALPATHRRPSRNVRRAPGGRHPRRRESGAHTDRAGRRARRWANRSLDRARPPGARLRANGSRFAEPCPRGAGSATRAAHGLAHRGRGRPLGDARAGSPGLCLRVCGHAGGRSPRAGVWFVPSDRSSSSESRWSLSISPLRCSCSRRRRFAGRITYRRSDFDEAIDLLSRGRIPTAELITGVVPLEETETMFQALTAPGNTHVKVLLEP